ncbi:MIF-like protein mif-2 [Lingula anatina]|uniref:L-dopachrome isomerase n=1 Tax=Lingula anatina TaxID=7574 RepID=A0A1S3HEE9_LINAN|nr:MIF-like protein mif-2 [Lingula anatina]|eukprot:XP_013383444.1 MIF-like protein mif-2 [Lingula anatina]
MLRLLNSKILTLYRRSFHTSSSLTMPLCRLETNLSNEQIPEDFPIKLTEMLSKLMDKPKNRILVVMQPNMTIYHDCKQLPFAILNIKSVARFNPENNKKYFPEIVKFLLAELKVEPEKLEILLEDISPDFVGTGEGLLSQTM